MNRWSESRTYIIAEAGVNHNGSLEMARRLVDAAFEAGADAVKFQAFRASKMTAGTAPRAEYQMRASNRKESQLEMLQRLELGEEQHRRLAAYCREKGLGFLSTPFDLESLEMLVDRIGISAVKISSGDMTYGPLLLETARRGCNIILSTGMSTLGEIEEALSLISFGYTNSEGDPSPEVLREAFLDPETRGTLQKKICLLQCTTEYPAPPEEVNLRAMDAMRAAFGLKVGFSDHTAGITAPIAAVACGASVVEKHFTLDRTLPGPDHKASLEPDELAAMVSAVRETESLLGVPWKGPGPSERKNLAVARKSLVAAKKIREGDPFGEENLTCKRPATGISPMRFWEMKGRRATRDYEKDELI